MSDVFFEELEIPKPGYRLGVSGGTHGSMTGQMLKRLETVTQQERLDCIMFYGDTTTPPWPARCLNYCKMAWMPGRFSK